jgi:hypothetical protein
MYCWFVETLCRTVESDWCKVPSLGAYSLTSTALFGYLLLAGEPFPFVIEPPLSDCTGPTPEIPPPGSRAAAALLNEGVLWDWVKRDASKGSIEGGGLAGNDAGAPHFDILELCGDI